MPVISGTVTCVANTRTAEQISGPNEFVQELSRVDLYGITSATPALCLCFAGSDVISDDRNVNFVGTSLDTSAHLLESVYVTPGTRLSLKFISTGTPTILWTVRITPV